MLPELSMAACKIRMPGLSDDIKAEKQFAKHRAGQFYDMCVRTRLRAPGNEKPNQVWTKEGTKLDVLPMERKTKNKRVNVADYEIEYSINFGEWINSGLTLERKHWKDFFDTVIFRYETFMNELERFEEDNVLFSFRIIVEGNVKQILDHVSIVPSICKCCDFCHPYHNNKKNIHKYNCTFDVLAGKAEKPKEVDPIGSCIFCVSHVKSEDELEGINNRLRAIIEDFESMNYHISFYDSREVAMSFVKDIAKRHFVTHYVRLLNL